MFIVLPLHRESLREMMNQRRVNHSIKIQVLQKLKSMIASDSSFCHGDIKELLIIQYQNLDRDLKNQRNSRTIF